MQDDKLLKFLEQNAPDRLQYDDVEVPFRPEPVATDFSGPEERDEAERAMAMEGMLSQLQQWQAQPKKAPRNRVPAEAKAAKEMSDINSLKGKAKQAVKEVKVDSANKEVEADNAPKDSREELLAQYKKLMEGRQDSIDKARGRDADTEFMANILKSGSLLNKALASQGGYKVDPGQVVTPKSDFERQMKEDYKTRLENLMTQAKSSGKKSLSDLDKAKLETEKLKQDKLRSEKSRKDQELDIKKAKESRAKEEADRETKEIIGQADDKINRIDEIKKKLKKGGVTGIFDAYIAGPIDYALGGDDYQTRKELQDLVVDQTLLKTAQTKGAISDAEMALFKSGIPSMGAQEEVWSDWLDKVKQAQQNIKNRLQKGEAAPVVREVRRRTKEGKTAIFDADTKQFLRYEE